MANRHGNYKPEEDADERNTVQCSGCRTALLPSTVQAMLSYIRGLQPQLARPRRIVSSPPPPQIV